MVARIEIEGIGVAAHEKEMTNSVRALPGVREAKIENGLPEDTSSAASADKKKEDGKGG